MHKLLLISLVTIPLIFGSKQNYSTTAVVTLVGATISAKSAKIEEKYKRKDCPVCEGKGWYWSGDLIKKIPCQYCEE